MALHEAVYRTSMVAFYQQGALRKTIYLRQELPMTSLRENCSSPKFDNRAAHLSLRPELRSTDRSLAKIKPRENNPEQKHLDALFDVSSFKQHFQPKSTILLHGDTADAIFRIVSGTVRCCTIDAEWTAANILFCEKGRLYRNLGHQCMAFYGGSHRSRHYKVNSTINP